MAKRDYYEVLGVAKNAPADEIKRAYRKLARQYHPDANKDPGASKKFAEVQQAYDVLSDETAKKKYDQYGHAGEGMGDPSEAFRRAQHSGGSVGAGFRPEDLEAEFGGQYGDVFDQLFGGRGPFGRAGGRQRHPAAPPKGEDIEHPVTLTFEQAARGTALPLRLTVGDHVETIDVKVPAGVKNGSRVRIRGKGDRAGQQPGDLFIVVNVTPHRFFRRDGLDILLDLPLSLYEALLGTRVQVPTLDGPVTLTIPPGTSSGSKLRIKGRGMQKAGEKGDQFCIIKVVVPKNLSDAEQAFVNEMQIAHPLNPREDIGW